jgi:DNA-binding transcriptional regulator LsrR (DeoR family)
LEEIKQLPLVVGVSGGASKYQAILSALRGRLIDVLVTDNITATRLLKER